MLAKLLHEAGRTEGADGKVILDGVSFINLKWHENNFYMKDATPWAPVYFPEVDPGKDASWPTQLPPSWTTSDQRITSYLASHVRKSGEQDTMWQNYEALLAFVSTGCARIKAINSRQLMPLVVAACAAPAVSLPKATSPAPTKRKVTR